MKEIINAIQTWNKYKTEETSLKNIFSKYQGFVLDMSLFPQGVPLHAYAAIKQDELYFVVISQENDIEQDYDSLEKACVWIKCEENLLNDSQEISDKEAQKRLVEWKLFRNNWISESILIDKEIYQMFNIPTQDLEPTDYTVHFALKNDPIKNQFQVADLILKNSSNLYFDTVRREPPYTDKTLNYILELI